MSGETAPGKILKVDVDLGEIDWVYDWNVRDVSQVMRSVPFRNVVIKQCRFRPSGFQKNYSQSVCLLNQTD